MFDKQKLAEIEEKAKKEIKEEQEKTITAYNKFFQEEIFNVIKRDIAANGNMSLEEYDVTAPFNPRSTSDFETRRSTEHGLTNKELMEAVSESLTKEGYDCEVVADKFGEKSQLKVVLKTK